MKDRTIVLICALALANAGTVRFQSKVASDDEVYNDPKLAPAICEASNSDGVLVAHEHCNQYYQCWDGKPVARQCYQDLQYNPLTGTCDWPNSVDCGTRLVPDKHEDHGNSEEDTSTICASEGSEELLIAHSHCDKFYKCHEGKPVTYRCPGKLLYNAAVGYCDCASNVACGDRVAESEEETNENNNGNDDPSQAPSICSGKYSEGVLVAHENCNKFYKCNHGKPVEFACYGNLMFNPAEGRCDWPHNVECGDRFIPEKDSSEHGGNGNDGSGDGDSDDEDTANNGTENGGSGNVDKETCNCDPADAPHLCAKNESGKTLVAHEKCDKFYICLHGKPVTQQCPKDLLYNPYVERCDWPHNVECGNRVIPKEDNEDTDGSDGKDDNENSNKSESKESNSSDGNDDNNSSDNSGTDNGGNEICNCNPGEAPSLCAQEGSDGTLIAHEKCDKFYQCIHGTPIVQSCPSGLLYNPYKERCDWAYNVKCEDKSSLEENSVENSGEGNGNSGKEDSDNNTSENDLDDSSLENGPESEGSGSSVENVNDDPSQASELCSKDGSEGIYVANENCNMFYVCSSGKPVVFHCPNNLLYNPHTKECDWPDNVNCGDRRVPGSAENSDENNNSKGEKSSDERSSSESEETLTTTEKSPVEGESSSEESVTTTEKNPQESESSSEEILTTTEKNTPENESSSKESVTTTESNPSESEISSEEIAATTENTPESENSSEEKAPAESGSSSEENIITTTEKAPTESKSSSEENVTTTEKAHTESESGSEENVTTTEIALTESEDSSEENVTTTEKAPTESESSSEENVTTTEKAPPESESSSEENVTTTEKAPTESEISSEENVTTTEKAPTESKSSSEENVTTTEKAPTESESSSEENVTTTEKAPTESESSSEENVTTTEKVPTESESSSEENVTTTEKAPTESESSSEENVTTTEKAPTESESSSEENVTTTEKSPTESESSSEENMTTTEKNPPSSESSSKEDPTGDGDEKEYLVDSEAKEFCLTSSSNMEFKPHQECNKFYACFSAKPVVLTCPGDWLYNSRTEQCELPETVECGSRLDPSIIEKDGSAEKDGESIDEDNSKGSENDGHNNGESEESNKSDNNNGTSEEDNESNGNNENNSDGETDSGTDSTAEEQDMENDNSNNKDEGSAEDNVSDGNHGTEGNGDGNNGNNGLDSEVREYCAMSGSDERVLPHENCNQYYICMGGVPVVRTCSGQFLFNANIGLCDWPQNVNCKNQGAGGAAENGGNNNNDSEESEENVEQIVEESSEEEVATNESNAVATCSLSGSNNRVSPHDNCKNYYICANGVPQVRSCSGQFLFNAKALLCDWPQNVDCGDRVL